MRLAARSARRATASDGSFEGFCSGGGIRQLAQMELGKDLSCKQLCELADAGDADARRVLEKSADYLGRALAVLIDILNPERIVMAAYTRAPSGTLRTARSARSGGKRCRFPAACAR